MFQEKIGLKETLERQKRPLDKIAKKKYKTFKVLIGGVILLYYVLLISATFYFGWDKMEMYTYILSVIPIVTSFLYLLVHERDINPLQYLAKQKKYYFSKTYREFDFDILKLSEVEVAINSLKSEIAKIERL